MEKMRALIKYDTWDVVNLPQGKKPVGCKWVFTVKYKANGIIERYNVPLVVRGFTHTYRIDYIETFTPVTKLNTIQVLFVINRKSRLILQ